MPEQKAVFVARSKGCEEKAGLLRERERLLKDTLRHENLPISNAVRDEGHRQEMALPTRSLSKLINDLEEVGRGSSRERTHRRNKLGPGLCQTDKMNWNFGNRSPPANSDHAILVGLEPFSQ